MYLGMAAVMFAVELSLGNLRQIRTENRFKILHFLMVGKALQNDSVWTEIIVCHFSGESKCSCGSVLHSSF
jgi:hypothetical protein